jgi:hypothetical protein
MAMERKYLIIIMIFGLFFTACFSGNKPHYGIEYNNFRKEMNLPVLEPTWKVFRVGENFTTYKNPKSDSLSLLKIPHYAEKIIEYYDCELTEEIDGYIGPRRFQTPDGEQTEALTIVYVYKLHPMISENRTGWHIYYYSEAPIKTDMGTFSSTDSLTLEQAEAILKLWGLKRLNYKK